MRSHILCLPVLCAVTLGAVAGCGLSASDAAYSYAPPVAATRGETYDKVTENDFIDALKERTSTFAVDVDTASYSLMRRDVDASRLPAPDGVRPEEYINYFHYTYPAPGAEHPFSVTVDGAPSRFGQGMHLVRVGLQGRVVDEAQRKPANLVFLVDVSGSMGEPTKLPLVQYALKELVKRLAPNDTLGIVVYAGHDATLLEPTPVSDKAKILDAIDALVSSGGTNGEGGIRRAYALAEQAMKPNAINRVILCTDGDFNVGATGDELVRIVEAERDRGVFLTTLGFGEGNYNDKVMQDLADKGNGNYAYIDNQGEAVRVLGDKLVSTLQVIAKDVKVQVEFNPDAVKRYRLIGYENRLLANADFRNDSKDAGELGAGHSVTALYEVELTNQATTPATAAATVRLRYKSPDAKDQDQANEFATSLTGAAFAATLDAAPDDLRFAAAVAELSEILRHSKHSEGARFTDVITLARGASGADKDRAQFVGLAERASGLWKP